MKELRSELNTVSEHTTDGLRIESINKTFAIGSGSAES